MDVDLLRPGTVPIAPETILWFEFLLDKDLLLRHLEKEISVSDPSPTDLIIKFSNAIFEVQKIEKRSDENGELLSIHPESIHPTKHSLKTIALKMLTLKVTAYLKWDLDVMCSLPVKIQINLLQDLLQFTNSEWFETQNMYDYNASISKHHLFALVLYHRWLIKMCSNQIISKLQTKYLGNSELSTGESILCTPENVDKSLKFLVEALAWEDFPSLITFNSFVMPTEVNSDVQFSWEHSIPISKEEFQAQIHYDLATYYFFKESYDIAIPYFVSAMQCINNIRNNSGFICIKSESLEGFLIACNTKSGYKYNLTKQLKISIVNQFMGLLNIFMQDNIEKEIPLVHRIKIEIDIRAALSCGKFTVARDLLPKVQALNTIRFVLDRSNIQHYDAMLNIDSLTWAILKMWPHSKASDKRRIENFLMQLIISGNATYLINSISSNETLCSVLEESVIKPASQISREVEIPALLQSCDWDISNVNVNRNSFLDIRLLEERIISSYKPEELRDLLVKLTFKETGRSVWKINSKWELPIPLQSVIMAIPRGFLQDFGYVLLAKSKELMVSKDWNSSIYFLNTLNNEIQINPTSTTMKLARLIKLEILLVQLNELFENWPAIHLDRKSLYYDCESCLKMNESVLPRTEIIEYCIISLINLNHWDLVTNLDKRWNNFEAAITLAAACQDLVKFKSARKPLKDLWDLILPVFLSVTQTKRSSSGNSNVIHRDSLPSASKLRLLSLFSKLRDCTVLTVVISLLAKLLNILRDEASLDLYVEYINLWPAVISNANSYNEAVVLETLTQLVLQALRYYPNNVAFMRLMGDINFANYNYDTANSYYLKFLLVSTDCFNMPIRSDDNLFRRIIKCCVALNCHTQAAVFCQFLDEPDYMLAFRSLSEQKFCYDTVDGYYHCFWDVNILEFLVYHHQKRSELKRRKHAVQTMSLLELNASNNEEIQHEASNIRKKTFLQAMCRQYIPF